MLVDYLRKMQEDWALTDEQMAALLHVPVEKFRMWMSGELPKSQATIPPGMETAVPLVHIYKKLSTQLPETERQAKWLLSPHKDFDGNKPIDIAASSRENLLWLSYYLESRSTASGLQ